LSFIHKFSQEFNITFSQEYHQHNITISPEVLGLGFSNWRFEMVLDCAGGGASLEQLLNVAAFAIQNHFKSFQRMINGAR